jgi:major membrane immunogen (membrane-anchored lipoprotein)
MKKINIIVITIVSLLTLVGCSTKDTTKYQLYYFYIETCPKCHDFEKEALPLIEETFGSDMEIIKYDLDDEAAKEPYEEVVSRLIGFNDSVYGEGPFIALDGYFAKLGYSSNDAEELLKDMKLAINEGTLGEELSNNRYLFKNGKIK